MVKQPFEHEDLEVKRIFINVAREQYKEVLDSTDDDTGNAFGPELAAGLLYMNLADYLAEYLVVGLNAMFKQAVSDYYFGSVSLGYKQKESFNIGASIRTLERYEFPSKKEILEVLNSINKARNILAHEVFKTTAAKMNTLDEAVQDLVEHTEHLITLVDLIVEGLPPKSLKD